MPWNLVAWNLVALVPGGRAASTSPSPARTGLDGRARHVRRWASASPAQTARARSSRLRRGRRSARPVGSSSSSTGPTRWQTPARESTVRPTGTQRDRETASRKLTARPGSSGAGHWLHLRHGDKDRGITRDAHAESEAGQAPGPSTSLLVANSRAEWIASCDPFACKHQR
jgi:hypothetical protein